VLIEGCLLALDQAYCSGCIATKARKHEGDWVS
jgi:hypothetical protein